MVRAEVDRRKFQAGAESGATHLAPVPDSNSGRLAAALPKASFAELNVGRPIVAGLSTRFLRESNIYLYETPDGEARAAISNVQQLHLIDSISWTLQRDVSA